MDKPDYRDFEIEIGQTDGNHYPVAVLYSPSGQARTIMALPFSRRDIEKKLAELEEALPGSEDSAMLARRFGTQLFDALFQGDIRQVYDISRQATASNDPSCASTRRN